MKKLILSILTLLLLSVGSYAQCYTPNWSEPSLDSMLIYVSLATLDGTNLQAGDEIGIFDGAECVGVGVLTQELTGVPIFLVIEASRDNPITVPVDGFTPGHTITYRFCSEGEVVNPSVTPTYLTGSGAFVPDDSCVVELRAVNTAPFFLSPPDTEALEDNFYSYTAIATDIDGDTLTFSAPVHPAWLSFDINTHELSGMPGNDDVGDHHVILNINDGTVDGTQNFFITVSNVNDAPTFTSTPITAATQGTAYTYTATAEDIDGDDDLTFSAPVLPTWLSFDVDTQVLSGTPGNDDVGNNNSVTLSVSDGTVSVDQDFVIIVGNANDAPTFTSTPITTATQGTAYTYTATAEDINGDDLTYSAPELPTWLSFDVGTQVLSGTPGDANVGNNNVTLRVSDGTDSEDQDFVIIVGNVNDAPTFTSTPITTATQGTAYTYTATAEDVDGDDLTFSAPVLPDWLSFDVGTQVLSGTPGNDDVDDHNVTLSVFDGTVTVDQSFVIAVDNINDAPTFTSTPITTATQGTAYTYTATAEDIDGDDLTFSATVLPGWLLFDTDTHVLSGTPGDANVGDNNVTLSVFDGTVTVDQSFVITVDNVNDAPTFTSIPDTVARPGSAYAYTATAVDLDGDILTFTAPVLPGWLTFSPSTHILSATPGDGDVGVHNVTLRISDGTFTVDQDFDITVGYGNHAPTFTSDPATSAIVGTAYIYTITAQDIDGDVLTYSAPLLPDWLTFYASTNVISGYPDSNDLGPNNVTVRISDGTVSADQSFTIIVENENNAPTFTSTPILSALEGALYVYTATAEDLDDDAMTFTATLLPDWLTFDITTHILSGTPDYDDAGVHNVTLVVSDGIASEDQSFAISVEDQTVVGIDDLKSPLNIVVYPNPTSGRFIVELTKEFDHVVTLEIIDAVGNVMLQQDIPSHHLIRDEYNLGNQPAGIYFIKVYHDTGHCIGKLIIH